MAVVLLALIGAAGTMLGRSGTAEAPTSAGPTPGPLETLSAESLSVRFPPTWQAAETPPDIPGLDLAGARALEPSGDQASGAIVVGRSRGADRTLLPAAFLERLPETPTPDRSVRLADAAAYHYDDLTVEGADAPVTLYVAPLRDGVATVACVAAEEDCPGVAASLRIEGDHRPVELGPRKRYAEPVGAALRALRAQRATAARRLRSAASAKAQSDAARQLQEAYSEFARRLEKVDSTPLERTAHPAIIRAARRAAAAYGGLASAARANKRTRYERARRGVADREAALRRSLRALDRLGYKVG